MCKILITFKNSRAAIKADNLFKTENFDVQVIATPCDISSECGMSIMASSDIRSKIETLLEKENIENKIYDRPFAT